MHKCCLPAGVPSESPSAYEKSLVHKIFGGRLRSQVKCVQCSFCSNKFDPFLDLSLEINKAESLNKALSHFTAKEYLDGGERQYQCQKCKLKVKALKQLTISKAPCVLTIHLKRFGTHQPGQKIDKNVHFGPTLDLKPFVTGQYDGELKYTLYGVLVHAGWNTHSGHYYCFVRTSSGMWYILDDHQVRQVSEKVVLGQKAYMLFYVRDRRNFAPKKQADVQKESMIINTIGRKTHSNSNGDLKQAVQNGPINKREILTKESSIQKNDLLTTAESSALNKAPLSDIPSKVPVCKDAVEGHSDLSPIKGSCNAINNAVFATAGGNTHKFNKERVTKDDSSVGVVEAPNCCGPQTSVTKKDPRNAVGEPPKYEDGNSKKDLTESVAVTPDCNGHQIPAGGVCIADKTSQKVEGVSKESTLGDNGQRKGIIESVELSGPQNTASSLHQEALDRKCQQKFKKKKLRKRHITSMHLGSSILLGASLSLRKKKHKKIERHIIKTKNLTQEHLLDRDCGPTDLGPSTSEISRVLSLGGTVHSRGKVLKSGLCKKDNIAVAKNVKGSNCVKMTIDEEFIDRPGQNGAVLATGEQPKENSSSSLPGNQCDPRVANGLKESRSNSVQNGLMCMLTRGLEEKVVARWDEIELPSSQITESNGAKTTSIGYIGDEWDVNGIRRIKSNLCSTSHSPNPYSTCVWVQEFL
ncbi:ubiquitin-specific protease 23 [Actinidia rufa]|uniref:Ubiquitin-specific protease 23 n=1 Tax=Actinidia rufa TaxID=165716 RepID=A0A7J0DB69_9ERIC|nr:ubiquitin-specific protease 23 [Actinidia rufa]